MDQNRVQAALADLPLGAIRFFSRVSSTNDEAARWIDEGAPDLSLVVADEQTEGRGREGRVWYSLPDASLAISIILYPLEKGAYVVPRLTALGALAVKDSLYKDFGLHAQIKWPNDVLVNRRKVAGVLVEAHWIGDQLSALILGIGINIKPAAVMIFQRDESMYHFPATCVEEALDRPIERLDLLHGVMAELVRWRKRISSPEFLQSWEASLAFRGEPVQIISHRGGNELTAGSKEDPPVVNEGRILGLSTDGSLRLRQNSGEVTMVRFGEVRLRPTAAGVGDR